MRNSRSDVVDAALRVLGTQGLENCSMRRVATELGVQPSALYHHVRDKQTLLALMADEIVSGVGAASGGAAGDPRRLCRELRDAMLAVRDGADVVATASAFRLGASGVETRLAALVGADGARTLLLYTFGHTQSTQTHRQAAAFGALTGTGGGVGADPANGTEGNDRDPAEDADPTLDREPGAGLDASFDRGLDIILTGLAAS